MAIDLLSCMQICFFPLLPTLFLPVFTTSNTVGVLYEKGTAYYSRSPRTHPGFQVGYVLLVVFSVYYFCFVCLVLYLVPYVASVSKSSIYGCPFQFSQMFIYVYLLTYLHRVRDSNAEYFHVFYHTLVILLRGQSYLRDTTLLEGTEYYHVKVNTCTSNGRINEKQM